MINKVTLVGNCGQEPEIKPLSTGTTVATMSVATSDSYKDKDGQWQQNTEWHKVVVWGKMAENLKVSKGDVVYVEGKIVNRKYQDKNGENRVSPEVVASYVRIIEKRDKSGTAPTNSYSEPEMFAPSGSFDDDIPF